MWSKKLMAVLLLCFSAVLMGASCPAEIPKVPHVIYQSRLTVQGTYFLAEPTWNTGWSWPSGGVGTGTTFVQETADTNKYLAVNYPVAMAGAEFHKNYGLSSVPGITGGMLLFSIKKTQSGGDMMVSVRVNGAMTAPRGVSEYVGTYGAGTWHHVSIPLADFGAENVPIEGVVFQSTLAGVVDFDDIMITVPLTLKWPLGGNNPGRSVTSPFGDDWNNTYCGGLIKKHNGTDYSATAGWPVYAAEAGTVKHVEAHSPWASHIVLEHVTLAGQLYTTVYWHVTPVTGLENFTGPIAKGQQIATIANLATGSHLHFGVRIGAYTTAVLEGVNYAGTGGLPQTDCTDSTGTWPAFPAGFVDPNDTRNVLFQ